MRKLKEFLPKIIILLFLIIAIEVVACFTIYKSQIVSSRNMYINTLEDNSKIYSHKITERINDIKNNIEKDNENSYDFDFILKDKKITFDNNQYLVKEQEYEYLSTYPINFIRFSDIVYGNSNEDYFLIISEIKDENEIHLYLYNANKFIESINEKIFTEYAIFSQNGKIIVGNKNYKENVKQNYFQNLNKIENNNFILFSESINSETGVPCFSVGGVSYETLSKYVDFCAKKTIVVLVASSLIIIVLCILFALWLTDSTYFYEKLALKKNLYFIRLNKNGKIIKANLQFKNMFPIDINFFTQIKAMESKKGFIPGNVLLANLEDKNGNKNIVNFIVISSVSTYKLLGINIEDTLKDKELDFKDEKSAKIKLSNAYEKSKLITDKILFGIITIHNLTNLEAMFGKKFSEEVFLAITSKIKKYFNNIYILSDDYIGVMICGVKDVEELLPEMQNILSEINHPVLINANLVNVGVKAGFVVVDSILKDTDFDYIFRSAKAALNRTIKENIGSYYIFHESQKKLYMKYMEYDYDIEKMLQNGSFNLEFQPQYSIQEERITGFEALFRIKKVLQLNINILELIKYAERTGKMIILGDYIFNEGMKFAKSVEKYNVSVSLNVSPIQFAQAGFVDNFLNIYKKYNLKPDSISIEITESFLMTNFEDTINKINVLSQKGIDIHLDDFGTNYSSFLYLKKIPISAIKIDREFVKDITTNEYSKTITKLIIDLTKSLNLSSIIEGLEDKEQLKIIKELGGEIIQGYLFGKAMPGEEAILMLEKKQEEK